MSSQTEQIKSKLSVVDVIGSYVKLEKAGGNFKARCPFHNEKTPSFYVSPSRDSFHCFGCNKGGDIFSFVQEIEGLDFLGALEVLAVRAGIELKPVDLKARSENERLYALLDEAAKHFHLKLLGSQEAKQYLKDRHLTEETVRRFRLGFAKPDWNSLGDFLTRKGFREEEIEKAGLAIRSSGSLRHAGGRYYDRFRGRIMFPLSDTSGRVVGFSGRLLAVDPEREEAKYINTPQTALYDKSRVLFGYDKAKQSIRKLDHCVLVEGQMDLVSSHQAGVENCVAVSGTALTAYHLNLIKRLTDNLVMAFDGDTAGISAARRGVVMALNLDMEVKIALLPDGLDPADLVSQDGDSWAKAVAGAVHVIDFCLAAFGRKPTDDRRILIKRVTEDVLPFVAAIPNSIRQAEFVSKIASFVGVREEAIWDELKKVRLPAAEAESAPLNTPNAKEDKPLNSRADMIERKLFGLWYWQTGGRAGETGPLAEKLSKIIEKFPAKAPEYEQRRNELALEAELSYDGNEFLDTEIDDLCANLIDERLREEQVELLARLREAGARGEDHSALLARAQEIGKERERLKAKK
jgi:DNA primase